MRLISVNANKEFIQNIIKQNDFQSVTSFLLNLQTFDKNTMQCVTENTVRIPVKSQHRKCHTNIVHCAVTSVS